MRKISIIILSAVMLFGMVGCADNRVKESETRTPLPVYKYTYNSVSEDEFSMCIFGAPEGNMMTDPEVYTALKDAGINTVLGTNLYDEHSITAQLNSCDAAGLNYVVFDSKVININEDFVAENGEETKTRLAKYETHPSFAGLYCKDEPNVKMYGIMKQAEDLMEELYERKKVCYSNMLPMLPSNYDAYKLYNGESKDEALAAGRQELTYVEYISKFVTEVKPKYLSFDWYPFGPYAGSVTGEWFESLAVMRKCSDEAGIPFWSFVQNGGQWRDPGDTNPPINRCPDEKEINWNINTSLAYGAKGLGYFTGVHLNFHAENESGNEGFLDKKGKKTKYWTYANNLKPHLNAIDDILVNSRSLGIMKSGTTPQAIRGDNIPILDSFRELSAIEGNLLVGCFDYKGKTALYVVNNNLKDSCDAVLTFNDNYAYGVIQKGAAEEKSGKKLTVHMSAGEGVLITLK